LLSWDSTKKNDEDLTQTPLDGESKTEQNWLFGGGYNLNRRKLTTFISNALLTTTMTKLDEKKISFDRGPFLPLNVPPPLAGKTYKFQNIIERFGFFCVKDFD
jgi:hypothetical protein